MRYYIFLSFILLYKTFIFSLDLELWSETAIVIDYETEQILFQKNKDLKIPPASMTKLVNLYMVYKNLEKGNIFKNDIVPITKNSDYKNLPRDSSLMFLEQGQSVTLFELMKGLAVPSGNDAAIAIAEYIYGSVENYLNAVSLELNELGFKNLYFVDSSGFNDNNEITVADFVEFCHLLLKKYPQIIEDVLFLESFTYPKIQNGKGSLGSIKQFNHNPLIGIFPDCDGLKTGFINKSGLNISLTANRNDRRIIAVMAGIFDLDKNIAEKKRIYDGTTLLNYAFDNFKNIQLDKIKLPYITITNRENVKTIPIIPYKRIFSFSQNNRIDYDFKGLQAPIEYGQYLGNVKFTDGKQIYIFPLYSNEQIF